MKKYFTKTPWWLKKIFPSYIWSVDTDENILYLTFDDGPHPVATPLVLDLLKQYNARASFFCIGRNVKEYPAIYERILAEGHAVGNHTFDHLNGWKTNNEVYLQNVAAASEYIESGLFRPPYGRIRSSQARKMRDATNPRPLKIVMWDVLSGDFDTRLKGEKCFRNIIENAGPGSIIVCHDSEKALPRLQFFLPELMKYYSGKGFGFESLKFLD